MEAVLSIWKLLGDGFFRIEILLKEEEAVRRGPRPWVSFGTCYQERTMEAKRAALEVFDAFLQIAKANRPLVNLSPVAWAYGQTAALLRHEFGSAHSLQEFHKIKRWIKDYCDGKDQSVIPATDSDEEWRQYLCRESWQAPAWLRVAATQHFADNTSAWDNLDEHSALQRLDKKETGKLLDGICRWFWSGVQAALENKARLESINLASQTAVELVTIKPPLSRETKETTTQIIERQALVDAPELSKGVSEGKTVDLLHAQLKRIRRSYREEGWSPSQIRHNTAWDLAVIWEWIDRISDTSHKSEFLKITDWDDGDEFIFRQIATLYEYAPHLSKKPSWSTIRDWRKAFRGYVRYKTPNGRKPHP